jgi:hypothetical protein
MVRRRSFETANEELKQDEMIFESSGSFILQEVVTPYDLAPAKKKNPKRSTLSRDTSGCNYEVNIQELQ